MEQQKKFLVMIFKTQKAFEIFTATVHIFAITFHYLTIEKSSEKSQVFP